MSWLAEEEFYSIFPPHGEVVTLSPSEEHERADSRTNEAHYVVGGVAGRTGLIYELRAVGWERSVDQLQMQALP